jgi:hypothetical protein
MGDPSTQQQTDESSTSQQKFRVGHGLSLYNYPEIMALYKKEQIHIELNPISNYVMGHTKDLAEHPGRTYIKQDMRVSINSDDGSIFNYDNVSFDWLFVLGLWNLSIQEIYNVCLYSIQDSFFSDDIKIEMTKKFNIKFSEWFTRWKNKLHKAILEALPILSSYKANIYTTTVVPTQIEIRTTKNFDDIEYEINKTYEHVVYENKPEIPIANKSKFELKKLLDDSTKEKDILTDQNSIFQEKLVTCNRELLRYKEICQIYQKGGSYCNLCKKSNCNCNNNCSSCNENKEKYYKYKSKYLTLKNNI